MPAAPHKNSARRTKSPVTISPQRARAIWLNAQRLTTPAPFGTGPDAVRMAVEHLGYVQIDTISVIERCHHHILFNRIPTYKRADLSHAQSVGKTLFEYWTHALSLIPVRDFPFFIATMKRHRKEPNSWTAATPHELRKILRRVEQEGALTISDIKDDKLVDKNHPWASKKPSKRALQAGFYNGQLTISRRDGMLKAYELTERHFGWEKWPKPATQNQIHQYLLERALRAQGVVSLDSICHLTPKTKPVITALIEKHVRAKRLHPVVIAGAEEQLHWATPETLETTTAQATLTHILSPFDPLTIQRKRTSLFFNYDHLFEAYVPKAKRKLGYFTLPVLSGDEIVAAIDLKTDRQAGEMRIQSWHWMGKGNAPEHKAQIDEALEKFEKFQFERSS